MMPACSNSESGLPSGDAGVFRTTHWSVVLVASRAQVPGAEEALGQLCRQHWYPLYAYVRRKGFSPGLVQRTRKT